MPNRIPAATVAVFLATVACAASSAQTRSSKTPTLAESIAEQVKKDNGIVWSEKRPLTWADFKGKPPDDPGAVAAETSYTIVDGVHCSGEDFEFRVVAAFRPERSWVRQAAFRTPADSARALRHEQTHFDLAEVHARRLRRYFAELYGPCRMSSGELYATANRLERDEKAAQAQYDKETDFGRNAARQAEWDKEVNTRLTGLMKFAAK